MTDFTADSPELEAERAFERALLDSARRDELPAARTGEAWQKFLLASTALAAGTVAGAGRPVRGPGGESRWLALRYGALGALGGGAVVAAWFSVVAPRVVAPPVPAARPAVVAPVAPAASFEAPAPVPVAAPEPSAVEPAAPAKVTGTRAAARRATVESRPASPDSSLAAEIALLDAARTAIAIGAHDRALGLVERHRSEHPRGMLRREAEVLVLEALFESGNRTEASLRAKSFLDRFPDDPHAARVRHIAASARPAP